MVLSQLEEDQFIYYDADNNLRQDNRIFNYIRTGTKESKIAMIINNSFLHILNSYIINLVSQEKMEIQQDEQLVEIENTKHLLRKSLAGIQKYYETLVKNNYNFQEIEKLNTELNKRFENLEEYKMEYLIKINDQTETTSSSKSWLYQIYESTLKPESKKEVLEDVVETSNKADEDNSSENNETDSLDSEEEGGCLQFNPSQDPQIGDYFPENFGVDEEDDFGYIQGFLYILSKKMVSLFFTVGKHVTYFFIQAVYRNHRICLFCHFF